MGSRTILEKVVLCVKYIEYAMLFQHSFFEDKLLAGRKYSLSIVAECSSNLTTFLNL